jgi:signal transduction histidine kinase
MADVDVGGDVDLSAHPLQHDLLLNPKSKFDAVSMDFEADYKKHKAVVFSLHPFLFVYAVLIVFVATRGSLASFFSLPSAAAFCLAIAMVVVSVVTGHIVVFSRLPIRAYIYGITPLQMFHQWASKVVGSRHGCQVENAFMLSFTSAWALYLLGRCLVGQCPEGVSVWEKQSCNPLAGSHAVPVDTYGLMVIAPLIPQVFLKGGTRWTILVSWVICVAFLNAAHVVVGAPWDMHVWINLTFVILIALSYEHERTLLWTFLMKLASKGNAGIGLPASNEVERTKLAAIEADMNAKRAMVRHIGHELRNPMNTIQGSMEVLLHELKPFQSLLPPDVFEIVTTCTESCGLVRETISDLVSFEKIAAGLYSLELSFVSVLKYIDDCSRPFVVEARAKDVTLVLQKENCVEGTIVQIDPLKMAQVFRNLFSNAVKFTKKGGEVVVTITEEGSIVTVAVTDKGPGMTAEQIGRLFQEGVQFEPNKHQNGYVVTCHTTPVIPW